MQFFEIIFLVISATFLTVLSFLSKRTRLQGRLLKIGLLVLAVHVVFETTRWQMMFCYLVFLLCAVLLLKRSTSHIIFRLVGFIAGIILILTSGFYALLMPMLELPPPTGNHAVGITRFTLIDDDRLEKFTDDPHDKRELFVEVWYPATQEGGKNAPKPATLWQELSIGDIDRVSFFMRYMKGIETHSYPDVPSDSMKGPFPIILFNHGLQMFTAQNTLLMEHLASHGYIIISIAHPFESLRVNLEGSGTVLPEFITSMARFQEAMAWIERTSTPILEARDSIKNISSIEERSEVMLSAIKDSPLNDAVAYWELDNKVVLNMLMSPQVGSYVFGSIIDTTRIGVMGMSIGGATATEFAKGDRRITAAINVDGLQYGHRNYDSLTIPFMMLYSKDGEGSNDFLFLRSQSDYFEYTIKEARHADFTDITLVWPVMRIYGQLGVIPEERMVTILNHIVLDFWDVYLKEKPYLKLASGEFPEVTTKVSLK